MLLDFLLMLIAAGAFIHGYRRGLIRAIFSFVGIFLGMVLAFKFGHALADYLSEWEIFRSKYLPFLGFLMVLAGVLVFLKIMSNLIEKVAEAMLLGFVNKLIGGLLEASVLIVLLGAVLWYLDGLGLISLDIVSSSKSYAYLVALPPALFLFISKLLPFFAVFGN